MAKVFKKLQVIKLTSNFREAVEIVDSSLPPKLEGNQVLVKNVYAGVNATDINISAGRNFTDGKLPFDIGFEAVGVVEKTAEGSKLKSGDPVLCMSSNGYSEYQVVPEDKVVSLPTLDPKYIVASVVGLTAAIALDEDGIDVIWETIGGATFTMLFDHLAKKGRLVIIGGITGYKEVGFPDVQIANLPGKLLTGSKSLNGFFLGDYPNKFPEYIKKLVTMIATGQLNAFVDDGTAAGSPFHGIEKAVDAVEYLHSGRHVGKVVVKLAE